jgi:cytochrome c556
MRKNIIAIAAIGLLVTAAAPARISPAKAKAIMHERHEGMELVGKTNKILNREIKSDKPNMAAVRKATATMNGLARRASDWFPAGTGPDVGKTGAKAEIWQTPQDFAAKLKAFQAAANNLNAAARGTNAAALTAAYGDLGKNCKACHDSYRSKMVH